MRLFNLLLCVLFLGQVMSCKKSDDLLTDFFTKSEMKTIDKIIQYFDDYVTSQTENQLPIDKAYIAYFENMRGSVQQASDINKYMPSIEERIAFYKTLDRAVLSEIYKIEDTRTVRFKGENESREVSSPYTFEINMDGRYVDFLKELALRNDFFKDYYETIQIAGDISPTHFVGLVYLDNIIDFDKREERFVAIITLLRLGETIPSPDNNGT